MEVASSKPCSSCGEPIGLTYHPVMMRLNIKTKTTSSYWCDDCFKKYYSQYSLSFTEKHISEFEALVIDPVARKIFDVPRDYIIKGFWFHLMVGGRLGLVINYSKEYQDAM